MYRAIFSDNVSVHVTNPYTMSVLEMVIEEYKKFHSTAELIAVIAEVNKVEILKLIRKLDLQSK